MDRSRQLTLGGAALVGASALTLALLTLGGDDEEAVTLPEEVASAPTAPSQAPDAGARPARSGDDPVVAPPARGTVRDEDDADGDTTVGDEASLGLDPDADRTPPDTNADRAAPREQTRRPRPRPPAQASTPLSFCFPGVIPTPDACASRETILAFAGEPIGVEAPGGGVTPLTVTLADPDDLAAPEREVGTCDAYLPLKRRGWQALTSADMDRDLRMNRFCGLIAMARRAERPSRGGLTRLTYGGLETVPPEDWPSLGPAAGEARLDDPAIALEADDDRLWRIDGEAVSISLRDVGAADFDGDGRAEVLVHAGLAARGGTARGGGYLLAEGEPGGQVRLVPADLYGTD